MEKSVIKTSEHICDELKKINPQEKPADLKSEELSYQDKVKMGVDKAIEIFSRKKS